jgi:hypothetical protein
MKKNYYVCVVLLLSFMRQIIANPTITFFFEPAQDIEKIHKKIKKPGKLAKHTVHGIMEHTPIAGILVTYGGYIQTSSYNGEIVLPRKHQKPVVTILVTSEMKPVALFENTILHWTLVPDVPAQMYSCEQKHNQKMGIYWETKEISLPSDNIIPLSTIVIVANPKDIVIETGETPTRETANLVLPDIGVKKGIRIIKNSFYMLAVRNLFKPVETEEKPEPFKMLTHINE